MIRRVLSLLQGVVDVFHNEVSEQSPIERQVILGSSGLELLATVGVGFIRYFQSQLVSAIQSIDLSRTLLLPLSGLQNITVATLEGKFSRERWLNLKP